MVQAAFDLAVDRMRRRTLFGAPIAAMQHWQYRFAEHATSIEAARLLYQKAATRLDTEGGAGEPEASMAKTFASKMAVDIVRDALQVHGGYGFVRELGTTGERAGLEERYRDVKILEISKAPTRYCCG